MSVPCLNAEQRLSWSAGLPIPPAELPDAMERLHFAVVAGQTLGLIRPRREAGAVSLDLPPGWSVMRFERDGDEVGPDRTVRRYRLPPGLAARRVGLIGRFELGVERRGGRTEAWVRAADFPSRLLACPPPVPTLYAAFHAHVSYGYLRALRRALGGAAT